MIKSLAKHIHNDLQYVLQNKRRGANLKQE